MPPRARLREGSGLASAQERGGPLSFGDLAGRAEALLPASSRLTEAAAARLARPEATERMAAESALLAKALTDLEVSGHLYEAGQDEEAARAWGRIRETERNARRARAIEPHLALLLGEAKREGSERAGVAPRTLGEARAELTLQSGDALARISTRAATASQTALEGLLGLGTGELARAVGLLGLEIAGVLGQAEAATRLYDLFRRFLGKAYDALVALMGPRLVQVAGEQVSRWVEGVKEEEQIGALLERLYQTGETKEAIRQEIAASQAALERFTRAIAEVQDLNKGFEQKTRLVGQILPKLKWATLVAGPLVPQARLLLAAGYVLMSGYVILTAGDYVDAPRLQRLDRVPGVRLVVESHLS